MTKPFTNAHFNTVHAALLAPEVRADLVGLDVTQVIYRPEGDPQQLGPFARGRTYLSAVAMSPSVTWRRVEFGHDPDGSDVVTYHDITLRPTELPDPDATVDGDYTISQERGGVVGDARLWQHIGGTSETGWSVSNAMRKLGIAVGDLAVTSET